jgi:hypothetical protein
VLHPRVHPPAGGSSSCRQGGCSARWSGGGPDLGLGTCFT